MNTDIYKWGKVALIALTAFLAVATLGSLKHLRAIDPAYNSITVSGRGEAFAVPDVATFTYSVSADAATVDAAQGQVTAKMDAILKKLKDLGIEDKDVKTTDYSVWPRYTYATVYCIQAPCPPQQKQDGYTASHSILVKVRKADDAGKALAAAGAAGASNLSGLSFSVDDPDAVTQEARAEAIKDAKTKAEALAKELGVRLVRVVSFSDGADQGPMPYYAEASGRGGVADQAKVPTVPAGQNKNVVSVSVTYEIR
ncbi:SIMPL domain-containing protein [Candidatus Parcubacteria bacterium]|nr:SIMPL domain-containing protein [Candidatus Parcubacteria bacterium]